MGSRILLADDSITIQKVVNLTFADEGIEVVAVNNGDVAERRLAEVRPDLVLADIFMPGKNGYELCEAIKQNSQFRNVPVVLLVGAFEPFDQAEARRVRADAHLTKPFESRTLVETVRRLISASWRTTTGPIAPLPSPGEGRDEASATDPMPAHATPPPPADLNLSTMMTGPDTSRATLRTNTDELGSAPADAPGEVFDLGVVDMPAGETNKAALTDTGERFEAMELSSLGEFAPEEIPSAFDLGGQDLILDFHKPQQSTLGAVSGQAPGDLPDVEVNGAVNGEEWFGLGSLESSALDTPSGEATWQGNSTVSPTGRQSGDLRAQMEPAFAPSDGTIETACATMLAVDEPLGDVLLDEPIPESSLPYSRESLDMEFEEPTLAEPPQDAPRHFDLIDIAGDSDQMNVFGKDVEDGYNLNDQSDARASGSLADLQSPVADASDRLDWTSPRAGAYSTAQLDAAMMPLDTREYLAENSADSEAPKTEKIQEAVFESAAMWPEEELRFSPIDGDLDAGEKPAPDDDGPVETGFSFSPVAADSSAMSVDLSANTHPAVPANGGVAYETELSSAAIQEIVRRVVAEMSESVVREVAWEVVPDCVERVIDQLTRESLSKRD